MSQLSRTAHSLGLSIGRDVVQVHLGGDIDVLSAPDLERLMGSLDLLPTFLLSST